MPLKIHWILNIAALLLLGGSILAQSLPTQPCTLDALDVTFQAAEGPDHSYTLALNLRNISHETCFISSYSGGPQLSRPSNGVWVKVCYQNCDGSSKPTDQRITLAPGGSAYQASRWKTVPIDTTQECSTPTEMAWPLTQYYNNVYLSSRSLLRPICSQLVTTDYAQGTLVPESQVAVKPKGHEPTITWSNNGEAEYSRQQIPLGLDFEGSRSGMLIDEQGCPRLFLATRDATPNAVRYSRTILVQEIEGLTCKSELSQTAKPRLALAFNAHSALTDKPEQHDDNGEYTFDIRSLTQHKGHYFLIRRTDDLHLSMVKGKFIKRNWGPRAKGVSVSLTLDGDTYDAGTDIPLHIALENFATPNQVFSMDPYYDPPVARIELWDANGNKISPGEDTMWFGHGSCHSFNPGLVFPVELTLGQLGYRPGPGVYRIVANWNPWVGGCSSGGFRCPREALPSSPPK